MVAGRSLKFASCRGGWDEHKERYGNSLSCRGSNTQPSSSEAALYQRAAAQNMQIRSAFAELVAQERSAAISSCAMMLIKISQKHTYYICLIKVEELKMGNFT